MCVYVIIARSQNIDITLYTFFLVVIRKQIIFFIQLDERDDSINDMYYTHIKNHKKFFVIEVKNNTTSRRRRSSTAHY